MSSNLYKKAKISRLKGITTSRDLVPKIYVDGILSNPLSSYTLDDIFDYYGIEK